ncbi:transcriptional regulator [Massilia sp. WF1]|uniref:GlxA family transcriptional regulator n=1 Tax=unclassified Massilia TaxID=2609279 RepID=UPI00064AC221|nr:MULTISPECIES: helix-turn-helix domain-containing protein [unclassified Massilia]ALK96086.1 transcriptional regulator [Massilia sp. WG5]KLU37331.1 transcriptional regulator [Massilia sp. WF1]
MHLIRQAPLILFVTFPEVGLLDLTGPQTVFWAAQRHTAGRGLLPYERHTVSLNGGLVRTEEGVAIDTLPFSMFAERAIDTIVVPGASRIVEILDELDATVDWIREASARARRTASVCTGAFLLAQAGLLQGRRAATHWGVSDLLQQRYPSLDVDRDAIFVRQDTVWTSAGVTAGIDLALALVEEDCGRAVAMDLARDLVVFMKRPGGQSQHSELLRAQSRESAGFDELHAWILDNLHDADLRVELLAERARMSARNFSRVYKARTGHTPGKALELFRVESARRMLEQSESNLAQIALRCGFGDEDRMRTTFLRHLGVTPSDYRRRIAEAPPA